MTEIKVKFWAHSPSRFHQPILHSHEDTPLKATNLTNPVRSFSSDWETVRSYLQHSGYITPFLLASSPCFNAISPLEFTLSVREVANRNSCTHGQKTHLSYESRDEWDVLTCNGKPINRQAPLRTAEKGMGEEEVSCSVSPCGCGGEQRGACMVAGLAELEH